METRRLFIPTFKIKNFTKVDCWFISLMISLLTIGVTFSISENIPGTANVKNIEPEILNIRIFGDGDVCDGSIDPSTETWIEVHVRDNNTLADISEINLIISGPSSDVSGVATTRHFISWNSAGIFTDEGDLGSQIIRGCSQPPSLNLGNGVWIFNLRLEKLTRYSSNWSLLVEVRDEDKKTQSTEFFTVNRYSEVSIEPTEIKLSGQPGELVPVSDPLYFRCESNHISYFMIWASDFVGIERPEIAILSDAFVISDAADFSDDKDPNRILLDHFPQLFKQISPSNPETIELCLQAKLPDPFYVQKYAGIIHFHLES